MINFAILFLNSRQKKNAQPKLCRKLYKSGAIVSGASPPAAADCDVDTEKPAGLW